MQIIKRSVVILTCIVVLLSSLCLNSFAYSADYYDMLADGWMYDEDDHLYYIPYDPLPDTFDSPMFMLASRPNFPDFNPNDIPWESAPDYIKEILYNIPFISTSTMDYVDPWKIPFVLVLTNGLTVRVIVGINLMLGTYFATLADSKSSTFNPVGTYVMCRVLGSDSSIYPGTEYACCYEARFSFDTFNVVADWKSLPPESVGNRISRFTGNLVSSDSGWDYYCYGGNNIGPGIASSTIPINTGTSSFPSVISSTNASSGFSGNVFIYNQDLYSASYFSSFTPSTYEDKELEVSKGIWGTLKDLPGALMEKIEGFFNNFLNYILYFQADKPEHVNPFANILDGIQSFFDEQMNDVADFKNSLNSTLSNVVTYIESGSGVINTFLTAVPLLSAFVTFFVVFCIVRKVIGR